ncbi:ATP-binding protein [Desulfobacterota bacterium M19]
MTEKENIGNNYEKFHKIKKESFRSTYIVRGKRAALNRCRRHGRIHIIFGYSSLRLIGRERSQDRGLKLTDYAGMAVKSLSSASLIQLCLFMTFLVNFFPGFSYAQTFTGVTRAIQTTFQNQLLHTNRAEDLPRLNQQGGQAGNIEMFRQCREWIVAAVIIMVILVAAILYSRRLNHFLRQTKKELEQARQNLEEQVRERTVELTVFNEKLWLEIGERECSERFVNEILESIGEGLIVIDSKYRIVTANRAYCEQVNVTNENIRGAYCYEVSHQLSKPCFLAGEECPGQVSFATGEACSAQHIHYDEENNPVYVEVKSYPIKDETGGIKSVIEIVNDVTEKKKLEEQLQHAQKMEVVGRLAGGVAHDFNNILTIISGYAEVMRSEVDMDSPLIDFLNNISVAAAKATKLTRSLLAFSRKQVIQPVPVGINQIIHDAKKLFSQLAGENIEVKFILRDIEINVLADSGQIEQVLMNLVANARDAMPGGGQLTIETDVVEIDNEYVDMHGYGNPGEFAMVTVADTGVGIDKTTREKIFEPFFTTKEIGKGTGLGLAMVYGTVKQHNGYINVYSEAGQGTIFKIYLPRIGRINNKLIESKKVKNDITGGSETVLLAEDDESVREFVKRVLEHAGYQVIMAADGDEALSQFQRHERKIDILFLDTIMPKKNGKEVYEAILQRHPNVKVLFTSGYSEDIIHTNGILQNNLSFVPKPASPQEILKKLREVLEH